MDKEEFFTDWEAWLSQRKADDAQRLRFEAFKTYPLFDPYRDDPRFDELLKQEEILYNKGVAQLKKLPFEVPF